MIASARVRVCAGGGLSLWAFVLSLRWGERGTWCIPSREKNSEIGGVCADGFEFLSCALCRGDSVVVDHPFGLFVGPDDDSRTDCG